MELHNYDRHCNLSIRKRHNTHFNEHMIQCFNASFLKMMECEGNNYADHI